MIVGIIVGILAIIEMEIMRRERKDNYNFLKNIYEYIKGSHELQKTTFEFLKGNFELQKKIFELLKNNSDKNEPKTKD